MYQVIQILNKGVLMNKFTLVCYVYNQETRKDEELWVAENLREEDVLRFRNKNPEAKIDFQQLEFDLDA